jgi:hypothetical protein
MSNEHVHLVAKLCRSVGIIGVTLSMISSPTTSFALGTADERAACTPEVFRLCSSEIPNVDRIIACMKAKKASLSVPCKAVFDRQPPRSVRNSE